MLIDQPGKIRAYKLVTDDYMSPIQYCNQLRYQVGIKLEVLDADTNTTEQCSRGVNVATMDWCLKEWKPGYRIMVVEFEAADIAAIPTANDGKFRLFRCEVVGEKDLKAMGWPLESAK
jgi:hypothetical protein